MWQNENTAQNYRENPCKEAVSFGFCTFPTQTGFAVLIRLYVVILLILACNIVTVLDDMNQCGFCL